MDKLVNLLTINAHDYKEVSFNDKIRSREVIFIIANITKEQLLCYTLPEIIQLHRLGVKIEGIKYSDIFEGKIIGWVCKNDELGIVKPLRISTYGNFQELEIVLDFSPARIVGDIEFHKHEITISAGSTNQLNYGYVRVFWVCPKYSNITFSHEDLYSVLHSIPLLEGLYIQNYSSEGVNPVLNFAGLTLQGLPHLEHAFLGCSKYKYIGLGSICLNNLHSIKGMIDGCYNLCVLDFSNAFGDITEDVKIRYAQNFSLGDSFLIRDKKAPIVFIYLNVDTPNFNEAIINNTVSDDCGILPCPISRHTPDLNQSIKVELAKEKLFRGALKKCYFVFLKDD